MVMVEVGALIAKQRLPPTSVQARISPGMLVLIIPQVHPKLAGLLHPGLLRLQSQEALEIAPGTNESAGHEGWTCRAESPGRR